MHKFFRPFLAGFCFALVLAGCAGSGPAVVAKIGDSPLTLEEFEESYTKNNGGWEKATTSSYEDREKFLDLLVKFRLKVLEARNRGLLSDSTIKSELEGYEVTVATSYMLEKEIIGPKVLETYNRKKEEIRASHILLRLNPEPTPADTLAAYTKAMNVISLVPKYGFDTLATTYSEEQSASFNKGDLGYFSSGRMVPEFDDACYNLKVGEYTPRPVRTQFGYHVIKVTDRQPTKGAVRVSHILRRFKDVAEDSVAVTDSAWTIYRALKAGTDFAEAAKRYSQDQGSQANGGDIGFYERGRIPPEIENIFYGTPLDSVTTPVRMPYGYHIFKITGYKGIPQFADMEKELRDQYNQTRYSTDYARFVGNLAKQYRLKFDTLTIVQLLHAFDTTQTPASWTWSDTLNADLKKKVLLTCEGRPATVNDLIEHVNGSAEFKSMLLNPKNIQHMIERVSEAKMMEEHARQVPQRYPAFSKLLKEYQDGILLYRIEQDEVWKKVVVNDSLLKIHHNQTREKYRWPDRVDFAEILVTTDSMAKAVYKEIRAGKQFAEAAEKYTMRNGYKEKKGVWGLTPNPLNEFSRYAAILPVDSIPPPFEHPNGWSIIKVLAKDSSRVKTFEEAMPEVMSSYQEYASKARQDEWIAELKSRYAVVLKKELLLEAFKRKPVATQ